MNKHIAAAVLAASVALSAPAALAGSFTVYVGYADNIRASGFFPNPWLTSPGVVSQTPDGQSLDSGAVRIDNTGGAALTIHNFRVTFLNQGTYAIWSDLVIPVGGIGIFTQTGSYNFDTSEDEVLGASPVNVDATHPLGGCTNPANAAQQAACDSAQPLIRFDADGTPFAGLDAGHILDTFGYDLVNLGPPGGDGNESINWTLLGSGGTRSGTVPAPEALSLLGLGMLGALRLSRSRQRRV